MKYRVDKFVDGRTDGRVENIMHMHDGGTKTDQAKWRCTDGGHERVEDTGEKNSAADVRHRVVQRQRWIILIVVVDVCDARIMLWYTASSVTELDVGLIFAARCNA